MKFRVRVVLLAFSIFVICVVFFFFGPQSYLLEELNNDYAEVDEDVLEEANEDVVRTVAQKVLKNSPPVAFEADIFNASSRQKVIEQFIDWYDVRWNFQPAPGTDLWEIAGRWVTSQQIHGEYVPELGAVLLAMSSRPIIKADIITKGSQLKLLLLLEGHQSVIFKPRWYDRNYVIEGKPYDGHDRHNGEIAAFHLNRLFGFRRVPLTIGRVIDLEKEILPVATDQLKATFFKNGSNTCFYGKCLYCKGENNGVCANGTRMEGAVVLALPARFTFVKYRHPWGRTYKEGRRARWEYDDEHYCVDVQKMAPFDSGRLLLDIIDACVFDYIVGNADRHHFEVFANETDSMLIMFDNGKSYGNPFHDEDSILTPLKQCKRIRYATVRRLRQLRQGVLSKVLGDILSRDPLAPLLAGHHFPAMERRLEYAVQLIGKYMEDSPGVLVDLPAR